MLYPTLPCDGGTLCIAGLLLTFYWPLAKWLFIAVGIGLVAWLIRATVKA